MDEGENANDEKQEQKLRDVLSGPARSHPPPIYFLPAILLPSQRAFIDKKKAAVS